MQLTQKSSKTGQRVVVEPPIDAEELYRTYLKICAERDLSGSTMAETDYSVSELIKAIGGDTLS
jgi:hypothetical protein